MQVHRYAATKGSPERLNLSLWHFTCIMHPHSPNMAEGQAEEVHGDILQQYTNPKNMKYKKLHGTPNPDVYICCGKVTAKNNFNTIFTRKNI